MFYSTKTCRVCGESCSRTCCDYCIAEDTAMIAAHEDNYVRRCDREPVYDLELDKAADPFEHQSTSKVKE